MAMKLTVHRILPSAAPSKRLPRIFPQARISNRCAFFNLQHSSHLQPPHATARPPPSHRSHQRGRWLGASLAASLTFFAAGVSSQTDYNPVDSTDTFVFTTSACPYCKRAKSSLTKEGIPFVEIAVDNNAPLREALAAETGRRTVPVIFLNGSYVGGSDDLDQIIANKKLPEYLDSPPKSIPPKLIQLAAEISPQPSPNSPSRATGATWTKSELRVLKLEQIANRMASDSEGIARQTLKSFGRIQRDAFSGSDAVDWLLKNLPDVLDRTEAIEIGTELQLSKLLNHVSFSEPFTDSESSFFRLHVHEPPLSNALNAGQVWLRPSRPASLVSQDLRSKTLQLYELALSPDGRSVKYSIIRGSPEFDAYVAVARELQKVDPSSLTREEQLSFWINVYNSLIIHAMVSNGVPTTFLQRLLFYSGNKYNIGGQDFSLDDIEHGILRGNRPGSTNLFGGLPFEGQDPRRFLAMTPRDPRIHFALNCGAKSCPPIKLFSAENIYEGLHGATVSFCESEVDVDFESGVVRLSKILDWYKVDFGDTVEDRLKFLLPYLDEAKQQKLAVLIAEGRAKVEYKPYDWGVNE